MRTGATAKDILEAELEARKLSVRALAKVMASTGGEREHHRRALNRILKGGTPKDPTATAVEAALELPSGILPRFDPGRRSKSAGAEEREIDRQTLRELQASVAGLRRTVASLRRRIVALEARPPGEAHDNQQGAGEP